MKIHFHSFGCKVNSVELESIREQLLKFGHSDCASDAPEVVIINTCSVTSTAESKLRRAVRSQHSKYPSARIMLLGCYVSRDGDALKNLPGVTHVFSNSEKDKVLDLLCENRELPSSCWFPVSTGGTHTRGFLKIQDGCCNSCSYCIVTVLRGNPISRPLQDILAEIGQLCDSGVAEIVLSGINLGSWGMEHGENFATLLQNIADCQPTCRIRISSLELEYMTDEVLEIMAMSNGLFCRQIHVPLQSGSDPVLRSMNRRYSAAEFLNRMKKARTVLGKPGLTTDIIVGYPTEGEKEFSETSALAREVGFHRIHAFSYSPRKGTTSYELGDPVSGDEKRRRIAVLSGIARENLERFAASLNARPLEVVFDGDDAVSSNREGYSEEYLRVFSGGFAVPGSRLVNVPAYEFQNGQVVMTGKSAGTTCRNSHL